MGNASEALGVLLARSKDGVFAGLKSQWPKPEFETEEIFSL